MSWKVIFTLIKFLPEFVALANRILDMAEKGYTEIQIRKKIKGLRDAFDEEDPRNMSRGINDQFH